MSDDRERRRRVRSAIARVPVADRPLGQLPGRRPFSGLAALGAALVILIAAVGAGRWLVDYRAGSAGSCGSLDVGVMPQAPKPIRTIRLDQRWTMTGLGTRCVAGIRVYDGVFDIISYEHGTPSYAEPWTSASYGLTLGLLSDDRGRIFAGSRSSGFKTSSGQTVRIDEYEGFNRPGEQTGGDFLAGVHELHFKVQGVLQAVRGPWRFDGIAAKNGALSATASAGGRDMHLYDLVLRPDGFSVAYLPLGEVTTGTVVVTDPLTARDDRGTPYMFAGNERIGSSMNLYAKFSPAPPAGSLLSIEIPTVYVSSDQTWVGTLTLPAASPSAAAPSLSPTPASTASSAASLRFQPVANGASAPARFTQMVAADSDARTLYAVSDADQLYRSTDGGITWRLVITPSSGNALHVAAAGSFVVIADAGHITQASGVTVPGALFVSSDGGATWRHGSAMDGGSDLTQSMGNVFAARVGGKPLFLASGQQFAAAGARGQGSVLGSSDGEHWMTIGGGPGAASFAMLDVPIASFASFAGAAGSSGGGGLTYRVEGPDLADLRLVAVAGSTEPMTGSEIITGPAASEIWTFASSAGASVIRHSLDGGKSWQRLDSGLSGRLAGLCVRGRTIFALGDGSYVWNQRVWSTASVAGPKAMVVFQLGDAVIVQDASNALWRSVP